MKKIRLLIGYLLYNFVGGVLPHYGLGYTWKISKRFRQICGKLLFVKCGKNVDIGRRVKLSSRISIGDNSGIGDNSYLQGEIIIGNNVMMAPNVAIIASNHRFNSLDVPMNRQGEESFPIIIEDDVWIGYGATILAGVRIARGSVIAAQSVVSKEVTEYSVVGGNPARIIKKRN